MKLQYSCYLHHATILGYFKAEFIEVNSSSRVKLVQDFDLLEFYKLI